MIENKGAEAPLPLKMKNKGAVRRPVDQEIDLDMEAKAENEKSYDNMTSISAATIYDVTL
jgi:hypothetical protein